jgi:hypothetical protein
MSRIEKALENAIRRREPSSDSEAMPGHDPAVQPLKPSNPNIIGGVQKTEIHDSAHNEAAGES